VGKLTDSENYFKETDSETESENYFKMIGLSPRSEVLPGRGERTMLIGIRRLVTFRSIASSLKVKRE